MMINVGIRIGGLGISGYDADAIAYFERAGVTDATAKAQINAFVKGIKDLGLYNNMVSWLLRSAQNAGTGTTAYSLGGFGTFNGTLTNGPTWGADGVVLDGVNDFISTSLGNVYSSGISMLIGFNSDNIEIVPFTCLLSNQQGMSPFPTFDLRRQSGTTINVSVAIAGTERILALGSVTNGVNYLAGFSHNNSTARSFFSGSQIATGSFSGAVDNSTNNLTLGKNPAFERNFDGKMFFVMAANVGITESQHSSIYTLYKNTLGTGLGLP
jgi:hypothetical protein